jgi:hypothetical protein
MKMHNKSENGHGARVALWAHSTYTHSQWPPHTNLLIMKVQFKTRSYITTVPVPTVSSIDISIQMDPASSVKKVKIMYLSTYFSTHRWLTTIRVSALIRPSSVVRNKLTYMVHDSILLGV